MLCCAVNFDTKREIMSSGLEKNLVFLHGFANIICIITRKFDSREDLWGILKKIKGKGRIEIENKKSKKNNDR